LTDNKNRTSQKFLPPSLRIRTIEEKKRAMTRAYDAKKASLDAEMVKIDA
jgi:hypothetical protein